MEKDIKKPALFKPNGLTSGSCLTPVAGFSGAANVQLSSLGQVSQRSNDRLESWLTAWGIGVMMPTWLGRYTKGW